VVFNDEVRKGEDRGEGGVEVVDNDNCQIAGMLTMISTCIFL